jgi:hypothetical protein
LPLRLPPLPNSRFQNRSLYRNASSSAPQTHSAGVGIPVMARCRGCAEHGLFHKS